MKVIYFDSFYIAKSICSCSLGFLARKREVSAFPLYHFLGLLQDCTYFQVVQ